MGGSEDAPLVDVVITARGRDPVAEMQAVRDVARVGAADAMRILDRVPAPVLVDVDHDRAAAAVSHLAWASITAVIRPAAGEPVLDAGGALSAHVEADPGLAELFHRLELDENDLRERFRFGDAAIVDDVRALCRLYREGDAARRARLREALDELPFVVHYVEGEIGPALHCAPETLSEHARRAMVATALGDMRPDDRDIQLKLEDVWLRCAEHGVDAVETFRWGASIASEKTASFLLGISRTMLERQRLSARRPRER